MDYYQKTIKSIILKHYKNNTRELHGLDVYKLIDKKKDEIKKKSERYHWNYTKTMSKMDEIHKRIESEYESYFCFYNKFGAKVGYDRVNGNNKLKELLLTNG